MEWCHTKEAFILPLRHLKCAVLVHKNHPTIIICQFFLPWSLYNVPLKKSYMTLFRSILDLDHLHGLCVLAITITFKNHQTRSDQISYTMMLPTSLIWPTRASICAGFQPHYLPISHFIRHCNWLSIFLTTVCSHPNSIVFNSIDGWHR
jgi:hypothetical protein